MTKEQVLAVPRHTVDGIFVTGSLARATKAELENWLWARFYGDRDRLEEDRDYKQVIPYVLIRRGESLLSYERRGSEERLSGLLSVGVGGHVNPGESILAAALRELREEVTGPFMLGTPRLAGLLSEDETDVGKVHVGVVYAMDVPDYASIQSHETALRHVMFESVTTLYAQRYRMESWSHICMEHLSDIF